MNAPRAVLTVRGPEHPALLSTVCAILAKQGVALDDVSQSVLQGQVLLTLVHEATAEAFAPVRQALEVALEPLGAVISSAALTADVVEVHVREGDRVKAGQLLVSLDEREAALSEAARETQARFGWTPQMIGLSGKRSRISSRISRTTGHEKDHMLVKA